MTDNLSERSIEDQVKIYTFQQALRKLSDTSGFLDEAAATIPPTYTFSEAAADGTVQLRVAEFVRYLVNKLSGLNLDCLPIGELRVLGKLNGLPVERFGRQKEKVMIALTASFFSANLTQARRHPDDLSDPSLAPRQALARGGASGAPKRPRASTGEVAPAPQTDAIIEIADAPTPTRPRRDVLQPSQRVNRDRTSALAPDQQTRLEVGSAPLCVEAIAATMQRADRRGSTAAAAPDGSLPQTAAFGVVAAPLPSLPSADVTAAMQKRAFALVVALGVSTLATITEKLKQQFGSVAANPIPIRDVMDDLVAKGRVIEEHGVYYANA